VVSLAQTILESERILSPSTPYDATVVTLAALLHDIGDRKYLPCSTINDPSIPPEATDPKTMVQHALLSAGADASLASRVQTIVTNVSFTNEKKNPKKVRRLIEEEGYRELAIVQDADRLDAIGAVGIGRCFTFLGAQGKKHVPPGGECVMDETIEHFVEKLEKLEGMMKTETGRKMAKVRTERLRIFRGWWEEETGFRVQDGQI
jgi:HD superfamily phosphodiesterase